MLIKTSVISYLIQQAKQILIQRAKIIHNKYIDSVLYQAILSAIDHPISWVIISIIFVKLLPPKDDRGGKEGYVDDDVTYIGDDVLYLDEDDSLYIGDDSLYIGDDALYIGDDVTYLNDEVDDGYQDEDEDEDEVTKLKYFAGANFKNIAGLESIEEELIELFLFLLEPEIFTNVGAVIPKGVLLSGPPGTGKTLLAKALGNTKLTTFLYVPGSELTQSEIGGGAALIRQLFQEAKEKKPTIIFIDEVDAIGENRDNSNDDEQESTLNQLLTELDGFEENKGVIVIGATNRPDCLDQALIRPGRFSRHIQIGLPNYNNRLNILLKHTSNTLLKDEAIKSLSEIALRTPGFSGAKLANVINDAGLLAIRNQETMMSKNDLTEAVNRMRYGIAQPRMKNNKVKFQIAYHEVGHAIVGSFLTYHNDVEFISLIPRGNIKGFTEFKIQQNQTLFSYNQLLAQITAKLGGYVIEEIVFGDTDITTRSQDDLQELTIIARLMVTRYGMSAIGPVTLENGIDDVESGMKDRIDGEVRKMVNFCEKITRKIILDNKIVIDLIVDKLIEEDNLDGKDLRNLIEEYTVLSRK